MKKRLRKKRRLGEYRELGFELRVALKETASEGVFDTFLDALIDFVEAHNLAVGGGGGADDVVYVVSLLEGRGSVTPAQRTALLTWVKAREEVARAEGSGLFDLWYPPKQLPDFAEG